MTSEEQGDAGVAESVADAAELVPVPSEGDLPSEDAVVGEPESQEEGVHAAEVVEVVEADVVEIEATEVVEADVEEIEATEEVEAEVAAVAQIEGVDAVDDVEVEETAEAAGPDVSVEDAEAAEAAEDVDDNGDEAALVEGAERRTIKRRRRRRRPAGQEEPSADDAGSEGDQDDVDGATTPEAVPAAAEEATPKGEATESDKDERGRLQMLIRVEGDRVQVSVLEGRTLVEHYVADRTSQSIAGNIYLGKVQNVLPGMEAAFIDIGTPKNAVLYAGDVRFIADEFETKSPRIEDILEVGQSVLVQVVKDPMGSKGARLTTEISLPGRFLVLVPESDATGISRRLAESERERLRDVLRRIRPEGFGVIVRTAAEYTSEDKLSLDMQRLEELWKDVYHEATRVNPPELVYEEPDLVIRTVREIFSGEFRRLIVDDKEVYDKICAYLGDYEPDLLQRIQFYDDNMSLYRRYHVSEQLRQGLSRKVWLPSGGSLVFDSAEALTVIDVNTSKNVGKNSLEETVFQNNLEAAEEIGRQLRLRDIGGIIVIDFIDMETAKNRQAVLRSFREAVARDKTKTQVYDISELGLVEMTRKNVSEGLISSFSHACAECSGRGIIIDEDF